MNHPKFDPWRYVAIETGIAILINIGLALGAAILTFRGESRIFVSGHHGLVIDAIPQTFMGALMTVVGVLIGTEMRLRRGKFGEARSAHPILRIIGIAILMALVSTLICVGLLALILPWVDPKGMDYDTMLVFKAIYSTILAIIIAPTALFVVLMRYVDPAFRRPA